MASLPTYYDSYPGISDKVIFLLERWEIQGEWSVESCVEGKTPGRAHMIYDGQWPWAAVNRSTASPQAFLVCLLRLNVEPQ